MLGNAEVFEVDAPHTQKEKIGVLRDNNIDTRHVRFVPVDLETDDLAEALVNSGFDKERRSLFLWEGVTLYLTPEAVMSTLSRIASVSCSGSVLAFDYLNSEPIGTTVKKDEVVLYGMKKESMAEEVGRYGFTVTENFDPFERGGDLSLPDSWQIPENTGRVMNFIKLCYNE